MNNRILSVSFISLALALTACGGSKSSSSKKDKKEDSQVTKNDCMDSTEIKNAGFDKLGMTLDGACFAKTQDNTAKSITINGKLDKKISISFDENVQDRSFASALVNSESKTVKNFFKSEIESDKELSRREKLAYKLQLIGKNTDVIKNYANHYRNSGVAFINFEKLPGKNTLQSNSDKVNYGFQITFNETVNAYHISQNLKFTDAKEAMLKPSKALSDAENIAEQVRISMFKKSVSPIRSKHFVFNISE